VGLARASDGYAGCGAVVADARIDAVVHVDAGVMQDLRHQRGAGLVHSEDDIDPVTNMDGDVRVPETVNPKGTTGLFKVGEDKVIPAMLGVVRDPVIEASPITWRGFWGSVVFIPTF